MTQPSNLPDPRDNPRNSIPAYPGYPPRQYPENQNSSYATPGTDKFANESGKWLLWTSLLSAVPATLAVYPGTLGIIALLTLILPVVTATMGYIKSAPLKVAGVNPIYSLAHFLIVPIVAGVIWQYFAVLKTGEAGISTYPAWLSMFAMFTVSIIALAQAARLNPPIVTIRERFLANFALAFLLGTTIAAFFIPLVIIMTASLLFAGWIAYWTFIAPALIVIIVLGIQRIYQPVKARRLNGGMPIPPSNLIKFRILLSWSLIVASITFIIICTFTMEYVMLRG